MFNESGPWKRDLAAAAGRLEEFRLGLASEFEQGEGTDSEFDIVSEAIYQVERNVIFGTFAVRRLLGMPSKVTKSARATKATVMRFSLRPGEEAPDQWDIFGDLEMYEMSTPEVETISANAMCNLFVHSLILRLAWSHHGLSWFDYWKLPENDPRIEAKPTELAGLLVASDKSSMNHLTFVSLDELIRVFLTLANDEVTKLDSHRDRLGRMHISVT
ncbi:hypothetical protein G6031_00365 [Dietzia sp. CQ4]|uniref:hypothetical protein n=1 Tax=Dietzia sp. (strain CQ4) TaxID=370437 RepID=UPI0015F86F96|nr:hypothetical protein [Dietzia sp. CQ4]MBB1032850.1 hypothetical protein [Dietzia sp. CQ4]